MKKILKDYIDDVWTNRLSKAKGMIYTEMAVGYLRMCFANLTAELEELEDIHAEIPQREAVRRIENYGFKLISDSDDCQILYKTGRLIGVLQSGITYIFQYVGSIPKILTRTKYNNILFNGEVYSVSAFQTMAICSIDKYMEENGTFIEPWIMGDFGNSTHSINQVMKFIPEFYIDRLRGY